MFDFDGTLFRSWEKTPDWWADPAPYSFFIRPESLDEPCVPDTPPSDYWISNAVKAAQEYSRDAGTYMVLITGRVSTHEDRVKELVAQKGLRFNKFYFNPGMNAATFKKKVLGGLLAAYNTVDKIEIWENENQDNYRNYLNAASSALDRNVSVEVHNVHVSPVPLACGPEDFSGIAARVASRYLSRR